MVLDPDVGGGLVVPLEVDPVSIAPISGNGPEKE
jgi:hypothetical protein